MNEITVFLGQDEGSEVRERLLAWSRVGLLDDFLWTTVSNWDEIVQGRIVAVEGELVSNGDAQVKPVLDVLAVVHRPLVRLVVVQELGTADEVNLRIAKAAQPAARFLGTKLPGGTPLPLLNLVLSATGVSGVSAEVLVPTALNLVASAEDRAADNLANVLVRDGVNFGGHAALAVAVASGCWRGMAGPFDDSTLVGAPQRAMPVVMRSFARVIEGEPVVDELSRRILVGRATWPVPRAAAVDLVPVPHPEKSVDLLVDEFGRFRNSFLRFTPPEPPDPPQKQEVSVWAAIKAMFRFIGRGLRDYPRQAVESAKEGLISRTERLAQRLTYGEDSSVVVRIARARLAGSRTGVLHPGLDALGTDAQWLAGLCEDPPDIAAMPFLWEAVRKVAFGIVDGSDLPTDFTEPTVLENRAVIVDPALVVSDPAGGGWRVTEKLGRAIWGSAQLTVADCDPRAAANVKRALELRLAETEEPEPPPPPRLHPAQDSSEPTGEDESAAEGDEALDPNVPSADELRGELKRLDAWMESGGRNRSLLWRVGDRISTSFDRASEELIDAVTALLAGPPEGVGGPLAALLRRLKRRWLVIALLALLVVIGGIVGGVLGTFSWLTALAIGVVGLACWLVGWIASFVRYERDRFRLVHKYDERQGRYSFLYERVRHAASEVARFDSIYRQYTSWAEIVGWMLHHPWGTSPKGAEVAPGPSSLDPETLPTAMTVAMAEPDDKQLLNLLATCSHEIFEVGWLSMLYGTVESTAMEEFRYLNGYAEGERAADPDQDTPIMPTGARDHLRRGLESGEAQRTAYDDAVDEIAAFCRKQDPAHLFSVVNPLKRPHGLEPAPQGLDEFVAGILPTPEMRDPFDDGVFSSKARSDGKHRVDRTIVWLPDVVSDAVVQRVSVLPVALQVDADRPYLLFAGRVDCSEVLDVDALCLFDRPRASAKPEVPDDDGED